MRFRTASSRRRRTSKRLFIAAAAVGVELLPYSAHAQMTYIGSFGTQGTGAGDFEDPTGIAVGPDGTVYVVDEDNDNAQYFSPTGTYLGTFGTALTAPFGVAVSSNGTVYVPEENTSDVKVFNATGTLEGSFGNAGNKNGQFSAPAGVAIAPTGALYVVDENNDRVEQFSPTIGSATFVSTFGSAGTGTGQFEFPLGIAVGPTGNIYASDDQNNRIEVFSSTAVYQSSITGAGGAFAEPSDVAVSATGTVYVTDYNNSRIETFNSAGTFLASYSAGAGAPAGFSEPIGVAVAPTGMVYVSDTGNNNDRIDRFFDPSAWVSGANNFNDIFTGPITVGVGPSSSNDILGASLTLNSAMTLNTLDLNVDVGGAFTQAGGTLDASGLSPSLNVSGNFVYQSGSFTAGVMNVVSGGVFRAVQGGALTVLTSATIAGRMNLDGGVALTAPTVALSSGGLLTMNNAGVSATSVNISTGGEIQMDSSASSTITAPVANAGLLIGSGQINGALTNNSGGQLNVDLGQDLTITGSGSTNAGTISVGGGMLQFTQSLTNQAAGVIDGYGSYYFTGGLNNSGTLALAGSSSVSGAVTSNAGGYIHLSGNQPNVLFGAVANAGQLTIDTGASGTFYGAYTGAGPIKNMGSAYFNANSISGTITGGGNLNVGNQSLPTQLQIQPLGATSQQSSLTISAGSTLDLTNNAIAISFGSPANDPISTIVTELKNGYANGAWTGTSPTAGVIRSSTVATFGNSVSVGYLDGNIDTTDSAQVAPNQILVKYTLTGDANLDGIVNFTDFATVLKNFALPGTDWAQGDFTYNPNSPSTQGTNFTDFADVLKNFLQPLPGGGGAETIGGTVQPLSAGVQIQNTVAPLPEPASLSVVSCGAAMLLRRKRRPGRIA